MHSDSEWLPCGKSRFFGELTVWMLLELVQFSKLLEELSFYLTSNGFRKDIQCLFKFHLHDGKTIDDLRNFEPLQLLEVVQEAEQSDEGHLIICRVIHPLPTLNARTNGTYTVAGSKLDESGLTYILQGSSIKLRLLQAFYALWQNLIVRVQELSN